MFLEGQYESRRKKVEKVWIQRALAPSDIDITQHAAWVGAWRIRTVAADIPIGEDRVLAALHKALRRLRKRRRHLVELRVRDLRRIGKLVNRLLHTPGVRRGALEESFKRQLRHSRHVKLEIAGLEVDLADVQVSS